MSLSLDGGSGGEAFSFEDLENYSFESMVEISKLALTVMLVKSICSNRTLSS